MITIYDTAVLEVVAEIKELQPWSKAILHGTFLIIGYKQGNIIIYDYTQQNAVVQEFTHHLSEITSLVTYCELEFVFYPETFTFTLQNLDTNLKLLSGDSSGKIIKWNMQGYYLEYILGAHTAEIIDLCVSADGNGLISLGADMEQTYTYEMKKP